MDVKETVLNFFKTHAKTSLPDSKEEEYLSCYYLDMGIIDSLGIVEMIMEFEGKYGIYFSEDSLQSYEFQTIGGVINMVESLIKEKE